MDWALEEYEAQPIPTYPGSSLSLYYDSLIDCLDESKDAEDEKGGGGIAEAANRGWVEERSLVDDADDARPSDGAIMTSQDSEDDGGDGEDDDDGEDQAEEDGRSSGGATPEQSPWEEAEEDDDDVVVDECGFLVLSDPGLEGAFNLRVPPPKFDETGLSAYKELCRSMKLTPIHRFLRQLNEGTVDLKFYGVRSRTLRAIAQALMYNPSVHTLDLTGNWMSPEAAYYMAELLLRENIALQHLVMRGCNLSARAAVMLAEGVELNHTLRTLVLADNHLGDDGVLAMQEALAVNDQLQILDLSNNHLGAVAAASLAKALQENQTIEVLLLGGNNLYEDTAKGLQPLLRVIQRREKSILTLDLSWNALNVPAAVPLRVFLVRSQVQHLFLNNNRLPGPAIDTIKIGVAKSKTLQHLKIGFNPMEPHNALNLLNAAKASSTLQTLDLDGIRVHIDFIKVKKQLEVSREMEIIIEGTLSDYEIKGPNLKEMMLKRARFEGFKPKRKKRKKDFGHLLLHLAENGIETMLPEQFTEAALKKKKIKVREELLRALYEEFQAKKSWVDVNSMLKCYMQLFPDTVLPPPVLKKKKKKGKKRKKSKKIK